MNIKTLKIFCDLAELKSFIRTARLHQISQSAVSQHLHSLERALGLTLIERDKKNFNLTPAGKKILEYASQIVKLHEQLVSAAAEMTNTVAGTIKVSAIYSLGLHFLPPVLKTFMQQNPTVLVHILYSTASEVYNAVLTHSVDLGLVAYPEHNPLLKVIKIAQERMVVICHPNHSFSQRQSLSIKDLQDQKFIGFEEKVPTQIAIERVLRKFNVRVNKVMEFDNVETIKCAVEIEAGIAIVPETTVTQEVARGTLKAIPLTEPEMYRPVGVIYRRDKVLTPAMEAFLQALMNKRTSVVSEGFQDLTSAGP